MYYETDEAYLLILSYYRKFETESSSSQSHSNGIRWDTRLAELEERLSSLEEAISLPAFRVKLAIYHHDLNSVKFKRVPQNYYDLSLNSRAVILSCATNQLCKSIIIENTLFKATDPQEISNSKYYCLIIQYNSKFSTEKLKDCINKWRAKLHLSERKMNFQLAPANQSNIVTGFSHNAVCPLGMLSYIPVIISKLCVSVYPSYVWLGGGEVDLKLGISIRDLLKSTNAIVGDIADRRRLEIDENLDS